MHTEEQRRTDLGILKGVAIVLVVLGHIHEGNSGHELWDGLRDFIYTFHMPLFFIVSGYLFAYTEPLKNMRDYPRYFKRVCSRNIVPLASFTIITACYKAFIQQFIGAQYIDHPVDITALARHLLNPNGGFATFLWFIYALFMIQMLYPFMRSILKNDLALFLVFALLQYATVPEYFCLDLVVKNMPFFLAGLLAFAYSIQPGRKRSQDLGIAIGLALLYSLGYRFGKDFFLTRLVLGISMTWLAWIASFHIREVNIGVLLSYLGEQSLDIYLWHTFFIGVAGFVLARIGPAGFWLSTGVCLVIVTGLCLIVAEGLKRIPGSRFCLYGRA